MGKKHQIFISHSKDQSTRFAEFLKKWLTLTLGDNVKVWFSGDPDDYHRGRDDINRIVGAAKDSFACISVLTPENYKRPWILFEPGMFYGGDNKEVYMLLCGGLKHNNLKYEGYPIEGFAVYPSKKDITDMIISLNKVINRSKEHIDDALETKYPDFEKEYNEIFAEYDESLVEKDSHLEKTLAKIYEA